MNDLTDPTNRTDSQQEQVIARDAYFQWRETLVALQSAPIPHAAAIDEAVKSLEQAQLRYKATHGLIGNNPIGDAADEAAQRQNFSRDRPK